MSSAIDGKRINMEILIKPQGRDSQQEAGVLAPRQMPPREGAGTLSDALARFNSLKEGSISNPAEIANPTGAVAFPDSWAGPNSLEAGSISSSAEIANSTGAGNNSSENGGVNEEAAAVMAKLQQIGGAFILNA